MAFAGGPLRPAQGAAMYLDDGLILMSAGVAAGIDQGLHLVRGDFGS